MLISAKVFKFSIIVLAQRIMNSESIKISSQEQQKTNEALFEKGDLIYDQIIKKSPKCGFIFYKHYIDVKTRQLAIQAFNKLTLVQKDSFIGELQFLKQVEKLDLIDLVIKQCVRLSTRQYKKQRKQNENRSASPQINDLIHVVTELVDFIQKSQDSTLQGQLSKSFTNKIEKTYTFLTSKQPQQNHQLKFIFTVFMAALAVLGIIGIQYKIFYWFVATIYIFIICTVLIFRRQITQLLKHTKQIIGQLFRSTEPVAQSKQMINEQLIF